MFVNVRLDASPVEVNLEETGDCTRFHVAVSGGGAPQPARLDAALRDASVGRADGEDARIAVDAVRRMAAGRVGPGWERDLDAMLTYARDKGWLGDDGTIAAHVEWPTTG